MRKGFLAVTETISLFVDDISAIEKGDGFNFAFKFFLHGGQVLTIENCLPEAEKKLLELFFMGSMVINPAAIG